MNNVVSLKGAESAKKRLLIVEDDAVLVDIIKNYALSYFDEIYNFESAEKAFLFLENKDLIFDLSLIDFFLPGNNGDSLCKNLQKKTSSKILLMSGDLDSAKSHPTTIDFDGFLQKPLSIETLHGIFKDIEIID